MNKYDNKDYPNVREVDSHYENGVFYIQQILSNNNIYC